jgi:hypothetical protein
MPDIQPSDNPSGAGNEQGSPLKAVDLAWLAGHFDGDGWVGILRAVRKSNGRTRYSGGAQIMTTSQRIADNAAMLIGLMGATPTVVVTEPRVGSDGSPRRRKWTVAARSSMAAEILLRNIRPYLIEKGIQADFVLDYIEERKRFGYRPSPAEQAHLQSFAEMTIEMLRGDRHRDDPSTTTRLAPADVG